MTSHLLAFPETGISSGPNARIEYGTTLPLPFYLLNVVHTLYAYFVMCRESR